MDSSKATKSKPVSSSKTIEEVGEAGPDFFGTQKYPQFNEQLLAVSRQ
jgi:hypothetical protein